MTPFWLPNGTDVALRAVGMALAGVSIAFAIHMLVYGDRNVRIVGMEHLAIFARPREAASLAPPAPVEPTDDKPRVDMAEVGSLVAPAPTLPPPSRPELVAARAGRAWLRIDGAIVAAQPGQTIASLGTIGGIVELDGAWVVLDDKGAVLLTLRHEANAVRLFARKLIFD